MIRMIRKLVENFSRLSDCAKLVAIAHIILSITAFLFLPFKTEEQIMIQQFTFSAINLYFFFLLYIYFFKPLMCNNIAIKIGVIFLTLFIVSNFIPQVGLFDQFLGVEYEYNFGWPFYFFGYDVSSHYVAGHTSKCLRRPSDFFLNLYLFSLLADVLFLLYKNRLIKELVK